MTWESSIVSFVTALFEVSPVFDHYPPFRALLVDSTIDPNEKMERLIEFAKDADWKAASTVGRHRA
jgi:F0F1-type ATP synthase delta subunit